MQNQVPLEEEGLRLTVDDGVARLVFDRPRRKNALTQAMWSKLAALLSNLAAAATTRVLIVSGAGRDFCAGADISEFDAVRGSAETARAYEADNSAAFAAIRTCPFPTIASIRGICFGGGFGIAAACDLRLASPDAMFAVPAARLGLAYPVDAMPDIVAALGPQMARYMTFSAGRMDAAAALSAGFLLETVDDNVLDIRVTELAEAIAVNAPLSVRASKASIMAAQTRDPADIAAAVVLGDATFESRDYAEGRAAFLEKRRPVFGNS